jgi:hypothetical protein
MIAYQALLLIQNHCTPLMQPMCSQTTEMRRGTANVREHQASHFQARK